MMLFRLVSVGAFTLGFLLFLGGIQLLPAVPPPPCKGPSCIVVAGWWDPTQSLDLRLYKVGADGSLTTITTATPTQLLSATNSGNLNNPQVAQNSPDYNVYQCSANWLCTIAKQTSYQQQTDPTSVGTQLFVGGQKVTAKQYVCP
jgi:hypothetical protein